MSPVPQHAPPPRELDDLQLLAHGTLAPLTGFEGAHGLVTLRVPAEVAASARESGELELVDPEGVPLATVRVESTYVAGELTDVTGEVTLLARQEFGAFRRLHLSPEHARARCGMDALTVTVTAPLTTEDLAHIRRVAAGRPVFLLVLSGHGTPEGLSGPGLIRATLTASAALPDAQVVAVPLATRGEEALDSQLRERVVSAYAPGEVVGVPGTGELPEDVASIVRSERRGGSVIFFTGLSGSGKSTLSRALHDVLLERGQRTVTSLDGDVVRRNLSAGLTFSRHDRELNIRRIGWVAAEISRHGGVALCSPIAPFDATREHVRAMVEEAGGAFFLIHVATPLAECERRDRKGLYAKARRGEIPDFTGISSPYEQPADADLTLDTTGRTLEHALTEVLTALTHRGILAPADERPVDVSS